MLTSIIKIFESITQNSTCQSHSIHVIFWFFGSIFYRGFPFLFLPGFSHFHDLSKSCLVTFGVVKCVINKSFSCNDIHNCKKDEAKKKLFFSSSIHGPEHSMHSGRFDQILSLSFFFWLFPIISPVTKSPAASTKNFASFTSFSQSSVPNLCLLFLQKIKDKSTTVLILR